MSVLSQKGMFFHLFDNPNFNYTFHKLPRTDLICCHSYLSFSNVLLFQKKGVRKDYLSSFGRESIMISFSLSSFNYPFVSLYLCHLVVQPPLSWISSLLIAFSNVPVCSCQRIYFMASRYKTRQLTL